MTENEYVTATEATRLLDVSKTKMAKLLRSGEIPYIQGSRHFSLPKSPLRSFRFQA